MGTRLGWRRSAAAGFGVLTALGAVVVGPVGGARADEVKGTCAPSPSYELQTLDWYGNYVKAAEVDVSVQACAWTDAAQWSFTVAQAEPVGGFGKAGWRVRAWYQNGEATPDFRTVVLKIRVDHCPREGVCENDVAAFEAGDRFYRDHYTRQIISDETLTETGNSHQTWRIAAHGR